MPKYARRYIRHIGHQSLPKVHRHPIADTGWHHCKQPKHFLLLAEEAKKIAEKIRIEKINEQWAGTPCKQLLNQSFNDQLNSIQILEQLAPLQLAKEHLPGDIIDILERLGTADNIPHNQLYYIAENCADRYYSKVIETFVALLKHQFTANLMNDTPIEIFIDNGATPSILPLRTYNKFPILHTFPKTESNTPIHTGGGLITSHFWLEIPLKLQHQTIQIKALVCDSECPYDLILG